jgi:mono/diheme cytochrome c family protein
MLTTHRPPSVRSREAFGRAARARSVPRIALAVVPALAGLLVAAAPSSAQSVADGTVDRTTRDSVYTSQQAERGRQLFAAECAACHGGREFTGPLFLRRWGNQPLGTLFNHIRETMPQTSPGSLSTAQTADVVAYLLRLNGFPAGPTELPTAAQELARIRLEGADRTDR